MKDDQKQYQLNFLKMNLAALMETARQYYEKQGRGHLVVMCKTDNRTPRHVKAGSSWYITEAANAKLPDPDAKIEWFVREYNPDTEAVIVLYTGVMYGTYLTRKPHDEEAAIAA